MTTKPILPHHPPRVIFEIGCGQPDTCRSFSWMGVNGIRIEMFEPHPQSFHALVNSFGHFPNVTIHNVAIFDRNGMLQMTEHGDSTYVSEVVSPMRNGASEDYLATRMKFQIPCHTLERYDRGDIDIALIDVEGSEWRVISQMVSRPTLLSIEVGGENGTYRTPDIDKLTGWLKENRYACCRKDCEDEWYIRQS